MRLKEIKLENVRSSERVKRYVSRILQDIQLPLSSYSAASVVIEKKAKKNQKFVAKLRTLYWGKNIFVKTEARNVPSVVQALRKQLLKQVLKTKERKITKRHHIRGRERQVLDLVS